MTQYIPGAETGQPKAETETGRYHSVVQDFFDRFATALTAGDGRTIASMWETPALVIGDQEVHAVSSSQEVEKFFGGAKEQYNARGISDTRAEIVRLEWCTALICIVKVRWPYLNAEGKEMGEESSTYTLRRDRNGDLKLRAVVMHGAVTRH